MYDFFIGFFFATGLLFWGSVVMFSVTVFISDYRITRANNKALKEFLKEKSDVR